MEENAAVMLNGAKPKLQKKYGVSISAAAVDLAVRGLKPFASELYPEDGPPQKCVRILEDACKLVQTKFGNFGDEIEFNEKVYELGRSVVELIELYRDNSFDSRFWVDRLRSERDSASIHMNDFITRWDFIRSPLFGDTSTENFRSLRDHAASFNWTETNLNEVVGAVDQFLVDTRRSQVLRFKSLLTVEACHVAEVISRLTDVPLTQIIPSNINNHKKKAIEMTNKRVVNQERVVNEIFEILASKKPIVTKRPRGSFLLVGPTGVGKREIAKAVALHWYCDASRLVEIDMSEYTEPPMKSSPTYDLSESSKSKHQHLRNRLNEVVANRPYSVILLDKIDKASFDTVTRVLLPILSDGSAESVDFSKCIIFMTSSVGSDQLVSSCACYNRDEVRWKRFCSNPLEFYKNHDCTFKDSDRARVLIEATKIIGADLLLSLDKILVVGMFHNKMAVARLLLREIIRENYGESLVVHASNAALDLLFLRARKQRLGVGGKAIKQALIKYVISPLSAANLLSNVFVCVDTFVGTSKLSFRAQPHGRSAADLYFKFKAGTFDIFIADLKMKMEAVNKIFHLRSEFFDLSESGQSLSPLKELTLETCDRLLSCFMSPTPQLVCVDKEVAPYDLPSVEEKLKFKSIYRSLKRKKTSIAKATSTIVDVLVEMSDSSFDFSNSPRRNYMFEGLNQKAKTKLIGCLSESLGDSFFTYIKLDENYQGGKEGKKSLIGKVKDNPCMVVLIDGVEFADVSFYKGLLKIFDKGILDNVDFRRSIIILTSEMGNKRRIAAAFFKDRSISIVNQGVKITRFRTELLYRLDGIMFFDPVKPENGGIHCVHGNSYMKNSQMPLSTFLCRLFEARFSRSPLLPFYI
ncbi:hypothetical protein ABFS82_08G187400 [Erythranthe guttata]